LQYPKGQSVVNVTLTSQVRKGESFIAVNPVPRLHSRGSSGFFGETRRSMSSFAKSPTRQRFGDGAASEDTRCAFLHGFTAVASCEGG